MADRDKPSMRRSLKLVAPDIAPHRALILFGVLALLLEVAFRVLEPWPLKIVVDAVTAFRGAKVSHQPASVELLIGCGVALLLIVGLRALSNYLATICFALVGSRAATSLRARVFRHVQGLSQQFHARNRSADTVQRIVGDVARMQEVAITAGMPLMANVATLLVMVVVMFVLDPLLASVVLVAVVAFAVTSGPTSRKITAASRQTRKGEGQLANTAQESLASIRVVQAYGLENLVEENFTSANRTSLREGVRSRRYAARLERTTDVIVGFPGETDEDFQATLDLVEEARFASAFTFAYSPRPGTPAADMADQIPSDVVSDRYRRLVDLQERISAQENAALEGRAVDVLISEGAGRKDPTTDRVTGRAADGRLVHIALPAGMGESERPRPGDMVRAQVTHGAPHHLVADSALTGGPFDVRRTRAGDAWAECERRASRLKAEAEGRAPVSLGMPRLRMRADA